MDRAAIGINTTCQSKTEKKEVYNSVYFCARSEPPLTIHIIRRGFYFLVRFKSKERTLACSSIHVMSFLFFALVCCNMLKQETTA